MNNKLTDELLDRLATLSKLELSDTSKTDLHRSLEQMLTYVDKVRELATEDILPLTHFSEYALPFEPDASSSTVFAQSVSPLRTDIPRPHPHPEQLVSLAPNSAESYYIVPNTIHNN